MQIGVGLPNTVPGTTGQDLVEFARRADQLGFSTLAVLDRLVYDSYDAVIALAAAAAVTERIRLAPTVLLPAYWPSGAMLAKQLASVDRLAGGRLVLGVAAGGREDDFLATGAAYGRRGRRLNELLDEIERVWSGASAAGASKAGTGAGTGAGAGGAGGIGPSPVNGRIPIWVGGNSDAAMPRAARHGIGWISGGGPIQRFTAQADQLHEAWLAAGRTDTPKLGALSYVALGERRRQAAAAYLLDYYAYIGEKARFMADTVIADDARLRQTIDGYAEAGCDELMLIPCTSDADQLDQLAKIALP